MGRSMGTVDQVTKIKIGTRLGEWLFQPDDHAKRQVVTAINVAMTQYEADYRYWVTFTGTPSDEQSAQDKASAASAGKVAYAKHAVGTFFADTAKKMLTNSLEKLRVSTAQGKSSAVQSGADQFVPFVTPENLFDVLIHRDFAESGVSHGLMQLRYSLKQLCVSAVFDLFVSYVRQNRNCQSAPELAIAAKEYGAELNPKKDAELADILYTAAMAVRPHTEASVVNFFSMHNS